jgi:hypothetical protein
MKEYAKAKELCIRVLELQPENVKSLLRAAKASLALHEYEESAVCLKLVSELTWVWSMVEGLLYSVLRNTMFLLCCVVLYRIYCMELSCM